MKLNDFDFLSKKIYLYFYGKGRHKSIFGGIFTILMVIICTFYIAYLMINVFRYKFFSFVYYKKYVKNAGIFPFANNGDEIFHYMQLLKIKTNKYVEYNPKYIRILMTRIYEGYKNNYKNLNETEHWVYEKCREGIDDINIQKEVFNNSTNIKDNACIRYYYNPIDKNYYSIDDKNNFKEPSLVNGTSTSNFLYLNTIVEKCHNDSIINNVLGFCGSENEIIEYFENIGGIYLQLLQLQVETENHSNPIFHYINGIASPIDDEEIPITDVNLSPFKIEIKSEIVYPSTTKEYSYILDQVRVSNWKTYDNKNYYFY